MRKEIKIFWISLFLLFSQNIFALTNNYEATDYCETIVQESKEYALLDSKSVETNMIVADFIKCNLSILPNSITTELLYALFGEPILLPLEQINSFVGAIYSDSSIEDLQTFDKTQLLTELESKVSHFSIISASLEAITFATFELISAMLFVFSIFYLTNTMNEGTFLGKTSNTFWTFMKMSGVLMFIFPISDIGLNIVQLFIIFIAMCGSFLASLIWSILPMFKYLYISDMSSVDELSKDDATLTATNLVSDMVKSNICDIAIRQSLLLNDTVKNNDEATLSGKEFYNCIESYTPTLDYDDLDVSSLELEKTKYCASSNFELQFNVDCGSVSTSENHTSDFRESLATTFMPEARNIAKKIIGYRCLKEKEANNDIGKESLYFKYCSEIDAIDFSYQYKSDTLIPQLISQESYLPEDYAEDVNSLAATLVSTVESNVSSAILLNDEISEEIEEKISYSLNRGWFNAGTFLFDIGHSPEYKNLAYKEITTQYGFTAPTLKETAKEAAQRSVYGDSSDFYENLIPGKLESRNVSSGMLNMFDINSDLDQLGISNNVSVYASFLTTSKNADLISDNETSLINKMLFPSLIMLKEFITPIDSATLGTDETCSADYDNCKVSPTNPIATIVESGREMVAYTGTVLLISKSLQATIQKGITKDEKNVALNKSNKAKNKPVELNVYSSGKYFALKSILMVFDFLTMYLSINVILGLILGYILPIVIFIYFIGNAISWITSLAFAMAGSTLWLGMHLMPSKEANFAGHAKSGYLMLMDVFLKPVFIVLGVFGAFILSSVMIVILNVTFEIVMDSFMFFDNPVSVLELFYNFLLNMIYMIFLSIIFFKSAKSVYKIPNALQNWIGLLAYEEAGLWKEITGLIQKTFFSGIKKYLIFT